MVKKEFFAIYNSANKELNDYFESQIEPSLVGKTTIEKIRYLNSEKSLLEKINDEIVFRAYQGFLNDEANLLKMYSTRKTLLGVDDSRDIRNAVYSGGLRALIKTELENLNSEIPAYSYDDFVEGKTDIFSEQLNYIYHLTNPEDVERIRDWQAEKLVSILSSEVEIIIKSYQNKLKNEISPLEFLRKDLEHYQKNIYEIKFETINELVGELKKLYFLLDYDFSRLNSDKCLDAYNLFVDDELCWSEINPEFINKMRRDYNKSSNKAFSSSPIIFYSIFQVVEWIESVIDGKEVFESFSFPNFKSIVKDVLEPSIEAASIRIKEFKTLNNFKDKTKDQKETLILNSLDKYRRKFNSLEEFEKAYYSSIADGNTELIFTLNALFFDVDYQKDGLKRATEVYYGIISFISELSKVTGDTRMRFKNNSELVNPFEIIPLMHSMILDNDLHQKMREIYDNSIKDVIQFGLYLEFVSENMLEQLHELFIECVERLGVYLEDCELTSKVMFIQSRLKELKQRELLSRSLHKVNDDVKKASYITLFKEYLEIEVEFLRDTQDLNFFLKAKPIKEIKPKTYNDTPVNQDSTFSFQVKSKNNDNLKRFLTELNRQVYLLQNDHDGVEDLFNILIADDLNADLPKVTFNCETTQLYYIFSHLKPYFNNLTFSNIEKSQLFFTKNGNLLKAQNLSASKVEFPKNYIEIDQAFTLLQ